MSGPSMERRRLPSLVIKGHRKALVQGLLLESLRLLIECHWELRTWGLF